MNTDRSRTKPVRVAGIHPGWLTLLASAAAVAGLLLLLRRPGPAPASRSSEPLVVYCAAGIRPPVEAAAREYEKAFGIPVQLTYGGSHTLLASLELSRLGDLYLPADESYLALARAKDLIRETIPLARMRAVVCVRRGNPKGIRSLNDLLRPDVALAQANPDAAAIGQTVRRELTRLQRWDAVRQKTKVFKGTVNEVATDVKIGAVDAGFAWDAVVAQDPALESVVLPELDQATADITVAVISSSVRPTAALRLARYLAAPERGQLQFRRHHYEPLPGDAWAETPELQLLSGAMLRPAIEQTIAEFERREGARVTRVYNGCGILVAQMKAGERPDAYFSCDQPFMEQVQDLFLDPEDISANELVILTPRENPKQITGLADLARPGLRLGVGHEKQSALGARTRQLLEQTGLLAAIGTNLAVQSPTGDFLVNQLRTGSLDAVIVYRSNANAVRDRFHIVPLDLPDARAVQPVAIGRESAHRQLAARLVQAIKSAASRDRFVSAGFSWEQRPSP